MFTELIGYVTEAQFVLRARIEAPMEERHKIIGLCAKYNLKMPYSGPKVGEDYSVDPTIFVALIEKAI